MISAKTVGPSKRQASGMNLSMILKMLHPYTVVQLECKGKLQIVIGFITGHCKTAGFTIILMGKRESWLLYFNCLPDVLWLLVFCAFPHGAMGWSAVCDCGIF